MSASNKGTLQPLSASIGAKIAPARSSSDPGADRGGVVPWRVRSCRRRHRPELFEIKVIKCRDVDFQMAKKEILGYYKSRGEACPDEAASDLELDCHEIGDALHASKIYAEARKIDGPQVIVKTGRHKAQSITMVENAKAIIIMKMGTSRSALHNPQVKKVLEFYLIDHLPNTLWPHIDPHYSRDLCH